MASVILAGCIEPDEQDSDADITEPETPVVLDWGVIDCKSVKTIFPVDEAALAPHLPEGFTPLTPEEFNLPPDMRGEALIGIKTLECTDGQGPYGSGGTVHYGSSYSPVHPPENLTVPGMDYHFVAWDSLSQNETARSLMQEKGLPIYDGEADLSGFTETAAGFVYDVGLRMGDDEYRFIGSSLAPDETFQEGFWYADFMQGDDGLAVWTADFSGPDVLAGTGTLELAEGSRLAEVAGSTTTKAWILASSQTSFRDGNVTLPL